MGNSLIASLSDLFVRLCVRSCWASIFQKEVTEAFNVISALDRAQVVGFCLR